MVGLIGAVAGDQPERQRMLAADRPQSARGGCDRNLQTLRDRQQIGAGAAVTHSLPHQDHRPARRHEHVHGFFHALRVGAAAAGDVGVPILRPRRLLGGGFQEDIERHVEHDRSGASGGHGLPGLPDGERHHLAARGLEHALAIGPHSRGKVGLIVPIELLEGAAIELAGRHVAGHRQKRHRIQKGVAERDRQVGGAGAAGREGRGRPPGHPVIDIGHEAGHQLVMHRQRLDVVGALIERIDELDIAMAAQAEDLRHLLADEIVDDDLSPVEHILHWRRPFVEALCRMG